MKKFLFGFIFIAFISCSKENLSSPAAASIQKSSPAISFTSSNISISEFKAQTGSDSITVGFTTTFQKNVKSLEILRGATPNNLCSIYKTNIAADSYSSLHYTTGDAQILSTQYYIIKYTLQDNDWGYTPVFTLQTAAH